MGQTISPEKKYEHALFMGKTVGSLRYPSSSKTGWIMINEIKGL